MKHTVLIVALVVGAAVAAPGASAGKPTFIPPSVPPDLLISDSCPFPVNVHSVVEEEVVRIFSDGRVTITGAATRRFTNVLSGRSEEFFVPGTEFFTPNPDGTTTARLEGLHMPYGPPGFLGPGSPGFLWITAGPILALLGTDGFPIAIDRLGSAILHDLCAELA
jgi:hypothetical protein